MVQLYEQKCLENIRYKRGLPGAARDYVTISLWHSPVQIDLRNQQALGWGEPPQIKFLYTNPPRGATFVSWPPPNTQSVNPHLIGWILGAQGQGEPPANKILLKKPIPRSKFCLLSPAQFFILQEISDGVTIGVPLGADIWGRPLARCRARVKWGAHAKFWGDGLCRSGGRPPDIHTYIHTYTLSSLYYRFDFLFVIWTYLVASLLLAKFETDGIANELERKLLN